MKSILLILIVACLVYVPSLGNGFVRDDHLFVEQWLVTKNISGILPILVGENPATQGGVYRPVRGILYVIDQQVFGTNAFWYHLQAMLLNATVSVFIFLTCRRIVKNVTVCLLAGMLFAIHPVHTETISYISASMETWGTLFFFISIYLWLRDTKRNKIGSAIFGILAFFTYELTIVLPLCILLIELLLRKQKLKEGLFQNLFPILGGVFAFLYIRFFLLGLIARTDYLAYSPYHTLLTMVKVFARYIYLLFVPLNLQVSPLLAGDVPTYMTIYEDLSPILRQSFFDIDFLLALSLLGFLLLLGVRQWRKRPFISFGIFWFFITLIPVSYIIPTGTPMGEKYLYIASFGPILAVVWIVIHNVKTWGRWGLLGIIILFGFLTIQRQGIWKNDITFYSDMLRNSPHHLMANYLLGEEYMKVGNSSLAEEKFKTALQKAPHFYEARIGLVKIYEKRGEDEKVLAQLGMLYHYLNDQRLLDKMNSIDSDTIKK